VAIGPGPGASPILGVVRPPDRISLRTLTVAALSVSLALACCGASQPDPPVGSRQVRIPTSGGDELNAIEVGQGADVAVLSHGATGTKEDFFGLAGVFAERGWRAIVYDARAQAREDDLSAVVNYARRSGATSVVLVGGSLGASLSIAMASELHVQGVVSLSASADTFDALHAAEAIGDSIPIFVAAAAENEPYATDARRIADALQIEPTIVSGGGHGSGMFLDHPDLMDTVVTFASAAVGRV
jgi:pimeloyl-ACP methyl ester carboxylesterase